MTHIAAPSAIPQLHDTTHSPVALWQLDGDLNDSSGNGYNLVLSTGTEQYDEGLVPGHKAFVFDGATRLRYPSAGAAPAALRISGALTVEMLVRLSEYYSSSRFLISCRSAFVSQGNELATNMLYGIWVRTTMNGLTFDWQNADNVEVPATAGERPHAMPNGWFHLACTRNTAGTIAKLYINGREFASTTSGISAPNGGGDAFITMGLHPTLTTYELHGMLSSVKIISSELTAAQVWAEAQRTTPLLAR